MVLNECVVADCIGPADSELDEGKRDPLVAFLDDAGFAENDFVPDDVMRATVSLIGHEAPPIFVGFGFRF